MPEMRVENLSVKNLLNKKIKKIVPKYQRPYAWTKEQCGQLWEDIVDFDNENMNDEDAIYFLGTIVYYKSEDVYHIIDGQQRLTTLTILLKILYEKASTQKNDDIRTLVDSLAACIWETNSKSGKPYHDKPFLSSEVVTEKDKDLLTRILSERYEFKKTDTTSKYYKNYIYLKEQVDKYAQEQPTHWLDLCLTILNKCIVMPIECGAREDALRIFTTLNNRGMVLTDSDIFKGEIYSFYEKDKSKDPDQFIELWKSMEEDFEDSTYKDGLNFLFTQEMHVIRAKTGNSSKEKGLRSFFNEGNWKYLHDELLMNDLEKIKVFWLEDIFNLSLPVRKFIQCLSFYPNDYWKVMLTPIIMHGHIYKLYMEDKASGNLNKSDSAFNTILQDILKHIITMLFVRFIHNPSRNFIRDQVFNGYVSLFNTNKLDFKTNIEDILKDKGNFRVSFDNMSSMIKPVLALYTYLKYPKSDIFPDKVDIEHIFPRKWQNTNYNSWKKEDANIYLESIGNKIFLEKKLNIQAGNNYFGIKKVKYAESSLLEPKSIAEQKDNDWTKENIEERSNDIFKKVYKFFQDNTDTYILDID